MYSINMDNREKIKINEDKNKIFFKQNKISLKYPHIHDLQLQKKIALKKEFQYKYDGDIKNIIEEDKNGKLCTKLEFPHQQFVKTFINDKTPYNSLLLYHGLGSGKTCSAIGITEEFRKSNKYNPSFKKIIVIASPNVQENFKLQLFNKKKLEKINKTWRLEGCVGSSLLHELKNYNLDSLSKEKIIRKIEKIISNNYTFTGYEKFANKIQRLINFDIDNNSVKRKRIKKILNKTFDGCMIIIDEVHNIRITNEGDNEQANNKRKKIASAILQLVKNVNHLKFLFLSATPIFNDPKEIVFLLNLMNINDGYSPIHTKEIFDNMGNLLVKNGQNVGYKKLIEKANGYISYVRGENPYNFPFKIYPNDFKDEMSIKMHRYPLYQFNNKQIENGIENLDIHLNILKNEQKEGYINSIDEIFKSINDNKLNDFQNMDTFGYTTLQEPLKRLNICFKIKSDNNDIYYSGRNGLQEIMKIEEDKKDYKRYFNYYNKTNEKVFSIENIGKYSSKIESILNKILNSKGIVLVYSQYLDAGLIPLALALEELGFDRLKHNNLFSKRQDKTKLNCLTMNNEKDENDKFKQCKYAMITGDKFYSPDNNQELRILNLDQNKYGHECKVVLISQAGSEGLDFKNLRQVHIMEPWYNINRIEQIIGRAIRNCSHKLLPLVERNCQIYLHGSYMGNEQECIDLLIYRYIEQKSKRIGKVQNILKSVSVDCLLNYDQTNFSKYLDQTIPITLSDNKTINFNLKDKPYSSICDYGEICDFQCLNTLNNKDDLDNKTYTIDNLLHEKIIENIKKLFIKSFVFKRRTIIELIKYKNITDEHIDYALDYLIENKETIIDQYMRKGYLINIRDLYIFKPIELDKELSSFYNFKRPIPVKINELKHNLIKKTDNKNMKKSSPKETNKLNSILDDINKKIQLGMNNQEINKDNESELSYYMEYKNSIDKLNLEINDEKIFINEKLSFEFLVNHILENIKLEDELVLLKYLYKNQTELNDVEQQLFYEFNKNIYESNNITLYFTVNILLNNDKTEIYVIDVDGESIELSIATSNDKSTFGKMLIQNILQMSEDTKPYKYVSFMGMNKRFKTIEHKVIEYNVGKNDKTQTTGALFENKSLKDMLVIINSVIGKEVFNKGKNTNKISKTSWSIILQIISKYFTKIKHNNFYYYINKLQKTFKIIKN